MYVPRWDSTLLLTTSQYGEINTYFYYHVVWVLLRLVLYSTLECGIGIEPLKLVSLNVKGTSNFHKRKTIYVWCRKKNADFCFSEETHSQIEIENHWKNEWGTKIMSHGSSIPQQAGRKRSYPASQLSIHSPSCFSVRD